MFKKIKTVMMMMLVIGMTMLMSSAGCNNVADSGGGVADSGSSGNSEHDSRLVGTWEILDGGSPTDYRGNSPSGTFKFLPDGTCTNQVNLNKGDYGNYYNKAKYWKTVINNSKIVFRETLPTPTDDFWRQAIDYSFNDGKLIFSDSSINIKLIKKD